MTKNKPYAELESEALRLVAERVLADPEADPAHIQSAVARLSWNAESIAAGLIKYFTPDELAKLRDVYRSAEARRASTSTTTPDTR